VTPAIYPPGHLLAGTIYKVVRHLATGGMGSVYDVVDTTVEKRYVLKTLHPQLVARDDIARRMRDEAKSLAKLSHPNIVDVITAGATTEAQPMPFYVMERLVGHNLRYVLEKRGGLDFVQAYRIAIDVLDALEHAHENAIVHRDVKPENIFLHRNANGTHTTKLLDFGIVRLLDRKSSHTKGKFIGTLKYASPEQVTGGTIGPATDLYSLGAVLYEMIAGRGPFDDVGDVYAIGAAHAGSHPPRISMFVRGVSKRLERLLASALAKEPAGRPRDAFSFAAELRAILREDESKPNSQTMVNVVSDDVASTALAPETPDIRTPPKVGNGAPASDAESGKTTHAATPRPDSGPETVVEPHAPVSPIAPTLAAAGVSPRVPEAAAPAAGSRPKIDRDAATRASAPTGETRRIPMHDTRLDMPTPAERPAAPAPDIMFPPAHTTGFGSEARTRPPEHEFALWIAGAIAVAMVAIGGAAAYRLGVARGAAMQPAAEPSSPARAMAVTPAASSVATATATVSATPATSSMDPPTPSGSATEAPKPPPPPRPKRPASAPTPTTSGYSPPIGF
jgi:eukaryotic-like serine/threonine-protein kinase